MFRVFVSLAMAVLWTVVAHAQQPANSRLDDIIKRGTLRVGMTGDYQPFTYFDRATSKFRGFDVDMAEALGKALGVKVEFVQTAWPQLMKDFEADNFDIAMGGVSITLDRQKKGMFSTPIMREGKTPIARCADQGKYETIADIDRAGTRVIVNPGGTNERFAKANIKNAEIKTRGLLRSLEAFTRDMNASDRALTEKTQERVQEVHDRLLQGIMTGKKR